MMTRKDFNALAALANDVATNGGGCGAEWLAHKLADICVKGGNDNFDRERFIAAALAGSKFAK